ncbi:Ankyrin repeat-containing protein YAR1 [Golovinomyces cichoracearum]|uniref:Ankyrin repeat-containing protein YAR1 n=1 Tax=Golovinomyces cichoracearum TaxID=62708 RepID=A0A420IXP8_9PEZI|nr:Ankyrin repeat-containing protein YAR1 [Golovinomyces cichoracearum]
MGLSEEEIDDLLYLARTGDFEDFQSFSKELCGRENLEIPVLLQASRDEHSGNGVLHMAAANGHSDFIRNICKFLSISSLQNLTIISLLNTKNKAGNTPMHWAALNGHLDVVQVLMEHGADPTITNDMGHDAIYEAELNDKKEVVEWVLKEGGDCLDEAIGKANNGENIVSERDKVTAADESVHKIQSDLGKISMDAVETSI